MVSRYRILLTAFIISFPLSSFSQLNDNETRLNNRYRLDIPKEWQKPKLMLTITDVLPQTIDELKNMDFCTDGKATYCVHLVITPPIVSNEINSESFRTNSSIHYTLAFSYQFAASLDVFDSLGNVVSSLRLISPEEVFDYRQQFIQTLRYETTTVTNNRGTMLGTRRVEAPIQNASYRGANSRTILSETFLLEICEKKMYEIKKTLKKLAEG